jgi:hypothetical protein
MNARTIGGIGVAALLFTAAVRAETVSLSVTAIDFITSPDGKDRLLLQMDRPGLNAHAAIAQATLKVPMPSVLPPDGLELRLHPILTEWAPGAVDWEEGWSTPGGDIARELYGGSEFRRGTDRNTFEIDVTTIVLEMQDGRETFGLMLLVPPHRGLGFEPEHRQILEAVLQSATLEIRYMNRLRVPPRGRG